MDDAGIRAILGRFAERVSLVPFSPDLDVDVILYGVREHGHGHDERLHALLRSHPATVILLGWDAESPQSEWALSCGAHGHVSKTLSGEDLVRRVEEIHHTRRRTPRLREGGPCHPGIRRAGLTPRELEVLAQITNGLTNQEIADQAFLSINSVKTYVRMAYRKIGVTRRSQAVSWGILHGLDKSSTFEREPVLEAH